MIDERIAELIQAGADGELGREETARLKSVLADSSEARRLWGEISELNELLDDVPPLELPDGLHRRIVSQVELPPVKQGLGQVIFGRFGQVPGFVRYGLAAAAGLVLTVGVYESQKESLLEHDIGSMVGTIMRNDRAEVEETLDALIFDLEEISSAVRLQRRDGALVLDVLLDAKDPVNITVDFTSDGLQFDAIAQTQRELHSIEFADQAIQVQAHGRHHFAVLLHRDDESVAGGQASIKLRFTSEGKLLKEGDLFIH